MDCPGSDAVAKPWTDLLERMALPGSDRQGMRMPADTTLRGERGGQILLFDGSPMRLPVQWGPVAKWLKRGNEDHHERIKEVLLLRRPRARSSWPVAKSPGAAQQSGPMAFPVELPQKLVTASAGELALSFSMSEAVTKPRSIKP